MSYSKHIIKIELCNNDLNEFKSLNLKEVFTGSDEAYRREIIINDLLDENINEIKSFFQGYSRIDGCPIFSVFCKSNTNISIKEAFIRKLIVDFTPKEEYEITLINPVPSTFYDYNKKDKKNENIIWKS